ncbi:ferric reductase like transmembrane component [Pyrenophora seminiperda CCB06]|uniref:Ferric reductase like transmembrane component n=1 Tax=Pyrenophora seminiperda CCB06 TaxID=1302712 RepID=A0A3M7MBT0_9PLEO|nr:ferric reductase like transmembrane component [Pyrenophora seminiperda CCB06]
MLSNSTSDALAARHIQTEGHVEYTINYWGYAVRNFPCTSDPGSCEYLDAVYSAHYTSMIFTFILWAVIGTLLLVIILSRLLRPRKRDGAKQSLPYRLVRVGVAIIRRHLAPECTRVFRYTTRFQVVILALLCIYLTAFSFAGITYKTWVTPVKGTNLHNTRSGMGGFADRVGAFAFALTPLTIALCSRESILSMLTGIPYQSFNFLHRWTGRIILVQSFSHAIMWTIIEGKLYQPQPTTYKKWISQKYMIWGCIAQGLITFLFVFSLRPVIRWTGYEFFLKSHLIVAGLYLGACWCHWEKLSCWMIASLAIMGFDLVARNVRTCLIHSGYKNASQGFGFRSIPSTMETFHDPTGTIIRMTFTHSHKAWEIGQHFYLTFPALNMWQSHPFTPVSSPSTSSPIQRHTYIIRACNGETAALAALAESAANCYPRRIASTPVIMVGPYGSPIVNQEVSNILAISGGTGITYTLPVIMAALADNSPARNIELVWTVRHLENLAWIEPELADLKSQLDRKWASDVCNHDADRLEKTPIVVCEMEKRFRIRIFVTRPDTMPQQPTQELEFAKDQDYGDAGPLSQTPSADSASLSRRLEELSSQCPNFSITWLNNARPDVATLVNTFMNETVEEGRTQVIGSGPPQLGTQIRAAVAARNVPGNVWRGDEGSDVECVWDDRMG